MATPSAEQLIQQYFGWDALPTTDGSGWNGAYDTYITPDQAQALMAYSRDNGGRVGSTSVAYGGDGWSWDSGMPQYADSVLGANGQLLKLPGGQGFSLSPDGTDGQLRYQLTYANGADGWNTAQQQMASHQDFMDRIAPVLPLLLAGGAVALGGAGAGGAAAGAAGGDAATAAQLMAEYGGQGASYGGAGVGTMEGLGTAGYEAGAANAFNLGNTLGEGGLPGTLSPNSYWNPVTQSEMPYGEVGSTPMTDTPWYEKLLNNVVDTPGAASTLGKALLSFATTPTQGGAASGMGGLSGLGGSGGGSGGGSSGASSSPTITPQQLANPQFTKWDSPLGVQYKSINPLDNSSLAQALRSY